MKEQSSQKPRVVIVGSFAKQLKQYKQFFILQKTHFC
ncbi:unnamed protein product [Paramecium octaurelia]|uniref:Uncharacterized protein n=1 Tax=Paramecium octaurelia TaxID=43137 RepID=A0A8S1SMP1_PAROT|nr:unnamed protein product [Paramecium octaurelia]